MEERALRDTESLEIQRADFDRRMQALDDRERNLEQQAEEQKRQARVQRNELERISGLTRRRRRSRCCSPTSRHEARAPGGG